jgi:riboflavin transporter FmnP
MQENNQTTRVCTDTTPKKRKTIKQRFSGKRIALMAIFVAISYAISLLDFPIFPATPFLKLDFGNAFILLSSFLLGPIEGVIVCVLKETLRVLGSSSGGVGEIANMLTTTAYILLPSVIYRFKKGLKIVIPCLVAACFIGTAAALLTNRFITFPLYMGAGAAAVFTQSFWFIVAFNLIKTVSVGIITMLLYKRLSNFLKKMKI